jgi:hypothetical protein
MRMGGMRPGMGPWSSVMVEPFSSIASTFPSPAKTPCAAEARGSSTSNPASAGTHGLIISSP